MTVALCLHCGELKWGAICECPKCSNKTAGDMTLDILFSDHSYTEATLEKFGMIIKEIHRHCDDPQKCGDAFIQYLSSYHPEVLTVEHDSKYIAQMQAILDKCVLPVFEVEVAADSPFEKAKNTEDKSEPDESDMPLSFEDENEGDNHTDISVVGDDVDEGDPDDHISKGRAAGHTEERFGLHMLPKSTATTVLIVLAMLLAVSLFVTMAVNIIISYLIVTAMFALTVFSLMKFRKYASQSQLLCENYDGEISRLREESNVRGRLLSVSDVGMAALDRNGGIVWVNSQFGHITGLDALEVEGKFLPDVISSSKDSLPQRNKMIVCIKKGQPYRGKILMHINKHCACQVVSLNPMPGHNGRIAGFVFSIMTEE